VATDAEAMAAFTDLIRAPHTIADLGLPEAVLDDLVLRRALLDGRTSIQGLSTSLALSISLTEGLVHALRDKKLIEFGGMVGRDFVISLTDAGRALAAERMQACTYAGTAPIPLPQYAQVVRAQTPHLQVGREHMAAAFADLVIDPHLLDELGPAMMSRGAIFLYGPPGTGKTSIAERMIRVYGDVVVIPRAVEVDGQIITVFDPTVHQPVDVQPIDLDKRWVLCRRPCVVGGGELTPSMLDLGFDEKSGVYLAPLQMKANNGMFVVDDFGRQTMTPAQLLNRWIVPLDRRIDYLSLNTGVKFDVPFEVKVVFSTNLPPSALGDEAFFRRIQSKVFIGPVTDHAFDEILRRVSTAHGIDCLEQDAEYLRELTRTRGDGDLRPYVPVMVCEILKSICAYEGTAASFTRWSLDRVAEIYFTRLTDDASSFGTGPRTGGSPSIAAGPPAVAAPEQLAPPAAEPRSYTVNSF
jgi:predicted ATPase with chaperone activity